MNNLEQIHVKCLVESHDIVTTMEKLKEAQKSKQICLHAEEEKVVKLTVGEEGKQTIAYGKIKIVNGRYAVEITAIVDGHEG